MCFFSCFSLFVVVVVAVVVAFLSSVLEGMSGRRQCSALTLKLIPCPGDHSRTAC